TLLPSPMALKSPLLLLLLFSLKLIHYSKPQTDYLRSKATSISGLGYLHSKATPATIISRVTPFPNQSAFLANISVGDPPISQLLLVDTGSDLTWIQCLPCKCYPQTIPFFNPSNSLTYRNSSCESAPHAMPQLVYDPEAEICRYYLEYQDQTSTGGVLAMEKLTFRTADGGLASIPDVVFGCGHDNSGSYNLYSGVLGLGPGRFSVVKKFGSRFSYCFGTLTDLNYHHNILILGEGAVMDGDPTPLEIFEDRYYLNLQAISVGEKQLEMDPDVFERTRFGSGTVIDTGCSVTILVREAYETLAREIDFLLNEILERSDEWDTYLNPCYRGKVERDLVGFPVVTLHFAQGADLALDTGSLFVNNGGDEFCMAVSVNMHDDMSVIGASAQQSYNVGFDLKAMEVYFQRIDCELLDH
ncbi:PREDICTED: aspartyl protease UND-like, partial [Tarenaya hassleriana]|uniref:aspartyl protease UND-like n=1 Tax=Tarenaya hassleriana TaxID=28532 RepID=UPI0008FD13BC